jgi:hypothetical protein
LQNRLRAATTLDNSPYEQDKHGTDNGTDETGPLTSPIPANSLAEVGGYQGTDNSKDRGENKALGLLFTAGRNQFGDYSSNEADDYGPEKAQHVSIPHRLLAATDCPVLGAATSLSIFRLAANFGRAFT